MRRSWLSLSQSSHRGESLYLKNSIAASEGKRAFAYQMGRSFEKTSVKLLGSQEKEEQK